MRRKSHADILVILQFAVMNIKRHFFVRLYENEICDSIESNAFVLDANLKKTKKVIAIFCVSLSIEIVVKNIYCAVYNHSTVPKMTISNATNFWIAVCVCVCFFVAVHCTGCVVATNNHFFSIFVIPRLEQKKKQSNNHFGSYRNRRLCIKSGWSCGLTTATSESWWLSPVRCSLASLITEFMSLKTFVETSLPALLPPLLACSSWKATHTKQQKCTQLNFTNNFQLLICFLLVSHENWILTGVCEIPSGCAAITVTAMW